MELCSSCKYLRFNNELDEYCCVKLNEFTTLDNYCGYWGLRAVDKSL